MLGLNDIRTRAERRYREVLKSWGQHRGMFPLRIPLGKVSGDLSAIHRWVQELKASEDPSHSYTLCWRKVNSRQFGKNQFPTHVEFTSPEPLARFLSREPEWIAFGHWMEQVQLEFPAVIDDLRCKPALVLSSLAQGCQLLKSLRWMLDHPGPGCYLREIPDLPHSKFVEENEVIFRFFLDRLLPPNAIDETQGSFERRYGFQKREHFFICRCLDPALQSTLGWPAEELALHPDNLGFLGKQWLQELEKVVIVENQVNLHTMQTERKTLAIHGSGFAVVRLAKAAPWLSKLPVFYWGDLDVQGFEILSDLRTYLPRVQSRWMDSLTLRKLRQYSSEGVASKRGAPNLIVEELVAYRWCRRYKLRIEQERVPW